MAAAIKGSWNGLIGMALAMLGIDLWPEHCLAVAGASLILGGVANLARADWRALSLTVLQGAMSSAVHALSSALRMIETRKGGSRDEYRDTDSDAN